MSQRDHELMESPAADTAISVPASPPPRDSMEDADPSLTRKRPRLDSGSKDMVAMPEDRAQTADTSAPAREQLVEMTIRSQPSSSANALDGASDTKDIPEGDIQRTPSDATVSSSDNHDLVEGDAFVDSPPVIVVEDDEDDADVETVAAPQFVDADTYFRQFPFSQHGNYMQAVNNIAVHFQGAQPLDGTVLPMLAAWFEDFPDRPSHYKSYFMDRNLFWDELSAMIHKILSRRAPFGDQFCGHDQTEDEVFISFLKAYLRICARMLQVDAEMLSMWTSEDTFHLPLVIHKHLRHVHVLLSGGKSPLLILLNNEYGTDLHSLVKRLLQTFVKANGVQNLFNLATQAYGKVPAALQNYIAISTIKVLDLVGWSLCGVTAAEAPTDTVQFHRNVLHFFRRYDHDLQIPSKVVDTGNTRDLIIDFAHLLSSLCNWSTEIAAELVDESLDFRDPNSPTTSSSLYAGPSINQATYRQDPRVYPALVQHAWKFKTLRKYVLKGRMELRVMSIGTMDSALVEIWKEYHQEEQSVHHPVMQYLADFLLHERVVDYIISVDSHPQLISRSGNIVGFLVVTQRYSESQTDAIWNTVANSSDPRVVSATMTMLRNIYSLMHPPELLYLCTKLHDLPIGHYNMEILKFLRELTQKLQHKYVDWSTTQSKERPWNVCIRVLEDTSPSKDTSKLANDLQREAVDQFGGIAACVQKEERHEIYRQCAAHIANRSPKATGSVRTIYLLMWAADFNDADFFKDNPDVTRQVLEETCVFAQDENGIAFNTPQALAIQYRLELLSLLICRATEAIPVDLYQYIWNHLVGKHAQTNHLRDLAWSKLLDAVRDKPDNDFCKQLIYAYVPKLEPDYYTPGLYEFVAMYEFPTARHVIDTPEGPQDVLQIRGADLLWSMILSAPPQTIEDRLAKLLAARYLELDLDKGVTLEEVEAAHVALVNQCTQELVSTYKALRSKANVEGNDRMDIDLSDPVQQQNERRFTRTILFLKLLLMLIRTRPEFNRTRRSDSKVEPLEIDLPYGDTIEIKYQSTGEKQSIVVGSENTLSDVYKRLCHATGYSKINLFAKGQRLSIVDRPHQKVADLDLSGHLLLVQKAPGSEVSQPVPEPSGSCSAFEAALLGRFEELFACMDAEDTISGVLYDFLVSFPFRERIADSVMTGVASCEYLFPVGKPWQAKYAASALHRKLKEQLSRNTLDDKYLANTVRLIDQALLKSSLIDETLSSRSDIQLAGALVQALLDFLKVPERPSLETSSTYFSNEKQLVDRLLHLLSVTIRPELDTASIAFQSYATIVEASLHSRGVWEAFKTHESVTVLHKVLLLTDYRKPLREHVAKVISSVCGGALPRSSALTEDETAASFWTIISSVLPDATLHESQSEQLLDLADQVFRRYDESNRDEMSLRLYLTTWSDLLLNYNHEESVGRDEIDFVVRGFTKLLLSCIASLKSFKKSLSAGPLVERIWNKFLFIPRVVNTDDPASDLQLPVLESKTRKELYDLVLALAEDRISYGRLLELAKDLEINEASMALRAFSVDRVNEIRAPTGYVGLFNPRAICYMNSLLTQLFMNVTFRKFILGLHVADPDASQHLLQKTQRLFAQMQSSYRKSADPRDFAACVKVPEGAPIDINVQMDADEFYNLLFDQWEAQMISPKVKQQFRSFYGGHTVNQIKSKECEHISERVESFFVVQCDVQGKANLQESLQAFVEGDVMEGDNKYKCESCGGKLVDAVKRTCLKDVPDNLIFHLKRFDFDLVELRRAKINDKFDFPPCIDVSHYKADHLSDPSKPREEDLFELVGVLVHQGTSENGHYYSYVRDRPCPSGSMSQWVEFNDRDVDAFDQQSLPYQTFGGFYDEQFPRQQKQFSAYMLFYQRKTAIEQDNKQYTGTPRSGIAKVPIAPALDRIIRADNDNFIQEYSLYDPHHTKFIRQVLMNVRMVNHGTCSEDHQQEATAIHIVLEHLCQTLFRVKTTDNTDDTLLQLRKTVLSCSTCCHIALAWLATEKYALINMLLQCTLPKIRSQMRAFLIDSLQFLREQDPSAYGIESVDSDVDAPSVTSVGGILLATARRLQAVAVESHVAARGWDDFYLTMCQLSNMGHVETALLLNQGLLHHCLRVFCLAVVPQLQLQDPDMWRLVEKKKRVYNRMIEFVYTLLSKMDIHLPVVGDTRHNNRLEQYDQNGSKFPFSHEEKHWLHLWYEENRAMAALDRMLETFDPSKTEVFYPGEILKWMLRSKEPLIQQQLYFTVHDGVQQLSPPMSDPYVRAALPYCEACPDASYVEQVAEAVLKSAVKLREHGGEVHIRFFNGLLHAENEAIFQSSSPDFFYDLSLLYAKKYAVQLLLYDDDGVRRSTASHLHDLFVKYKDDHLVSENTLRYKTKAIRILAAEMCTKINEEQQNATSRSYMQPMIQTCHILVELLSILYESDDEVLEQHKQINDANIIQYYAELEYRVRSWAYDEGTPLSTGEGYDHSDYGSESDAEADMLDL